MSKRIQLTFVLTALLIVAALTFGTAVPKATTSANSPYASTLSNYAVGTALAGPCNNTACLTLQGITGCHGGDGVGTKCAVVNGTCTTTACKGH